jgi:plastocyanin
MPVRCISCVILVLTVVIIAAFRSGLTAARGAKQKADIVIDMNSRLKYTPDRVSINVGSTVEWKNNSTFVHTVTADPAAAVNARDVKLPDGAQPFNSGSISPGGTFRYTFTVPGEYRYFCIPHEAAGMIGEIVVQPRSIQQ